MVFFVFFYNTYHFSKLPIEPQVLEHQFSFGKGAILEFVQQISFLVDNYYFFDNIKNEACMFYFKSW